ncbi:MAG: hypothetical protein UZ18_ATM001000498 [Armatimonadetes bacterium OLB18]|nr:MAG: hypothetical protein UZ18_ATM001000498 [Armatimonadetes bacterium OLB18]
MGFWVAKTMNGGPKVWRSPSIVTPLSSMASKRAAWVLGGVRLISSASRTWVNTGPNRSLKSPDFASKMLVPSTSLGMRSGVN